MRLELTNLLPPDRKRMFRRAYFFRLGAVGALMITFLVLIHGVLLLPTHTFLSKEITMREGELAALSQGDASTDEASFEARLTLLSKSAERIQSLGTTTPVITTFTSILAIPHAGITLSGFSFVASTAKKSATISLSGSAMTRDTLRQYQLALSTAAFIASADLPVSTYAKDTKLPFTITLSLTKL